MASAELEPTKAVCTEGSPDVKDVVLEVTPEQQEHIKALFRNCDRNCDGRISRRELAKLFQDLDANSWTKPRVNQLFTAVDVNRDGQIDYDEFLSWCFKASANECNDFSTTMKKLKYRQQTDLNNLLRAKQIDWSKVAEYRNNPDMDPNYFERESKIATIHRSCYDGNVDVMEWCLEKGATIKVATTLGRTPLHYACDGGQDAIVRMLLAMNADPNETSLSGATPLHFCALANRHSTAEVLFQEADTIVEAELEDSQRRTPLMVTTDEKMLEIIRAYIATTESRRLRRYAD